MPSGGRVVLTRYVKPNGADYAILCLFAPSPVQPGDRRRRRGSAAAVPSSHPDQFSCILFNKLHFLWKLICIDQIPVAGILPDSAKRQITGTNCRPS